MFQIYRRLYEILPARDRRIGLLLLCVILASAIVETLGVASILPFIAVLANQEVVGTNKYLQAIYGWFGFGDVRTFLIFLGGLFLAFFLIGLAIRTFAFWAQARFANQRMHYMSSRMLFGYLQKDYEWFLAQDTSALRSTVLSEVSKVINESMFPALQIIAHASVITLLFSLLVAVDPVLAFATAGVLGGGYAVTYMAMRRRVTQIGMENFLANRGRFRVTQEAFGGIKDLKMKGLESTFLTRFQADSSRFAKSQTAEQLIGQLPGYAMQAIIFGGMLLVILYLMAVHGGIQNALPILAMYALAGYRMMPSLQNAYRHMVTLRRAQPTLNALYSDLRAAASIQINISKVRDISRLALKSKISLSNVTYRYPGADRDALQNIDLEIDGFSTVAFVGPTGCGKTTVVDVILGLLRPHAGCLMIDGEIVDDTNRKSWQRNVGYVPQDIYLANTTIAENIGYGHDESDIDQAAVERAARVANVHEFIAGELSAGYKTEVGERGIRLSGGQRQRIGIARAMYQDPDVIVLDEATSALDNLTEHAVMDAVHALSKQKTVILIAHRLSTVANCDKIFLMEAGRIVASGRFSELLEQSPQFRDMVGHEPNLPITSGLA